jgi:hypothetical protein
VRRGAGGRIEAVEFHAASRAWLQTTDPVQAERTAPAMTLTALPLPPANERAAHKPTESYYESRARREALDVQLRQLELAERAGKLVSAAGIEKAIYTGTRMHRDELLNLPPRVAPVLVGKSEHEITRILDIEIRRTLDRLVERFKQMAATAPETEEFDDS